MRQEPVGGLLESLDARPPFALLDVLTTHLGPLGATDVRMWLVDYGGTTLLQLRLDESGRPPVELGVETQGAGTAFRERRPVVAATAQGAVAWLPVAIRSERLGVLEVALPAAPDAPLLAVLRSVATAVAHVILVAEHYTDVFEVVRRRRELGLPAELQWDLLPLLAHAGPDFSVAGDVEPAYDIGGDNFDYAVDLHGITVTLTDAMGHGVQAAMLSTLAVTAQRNARRRGVSLRQQVRAANLAVHDQYAGDAFLTEMGVRVDRDTGVAGIVNAGHSYGYLLREGRVEQIAVAPDLPVGLFPDTAYTVHELQLRPGDRIVLASDGIIEAAPDRGEEFGPQRLAAHLLRTATESAQVVVRSLTAAAMAYEGAFLHDDATAVCLDYRGLDRPDAAVATSSG